MTSQHEADNVLNGISDFAISWKMITKLLMCHTALGSTFLTKNTPVRDVFLAGGVGWSDHISCDIQAPPHPTKVNILHTFTVCMCIQHWVWYRFTCHILTVQHLFCAQSFQKCYYKKKSRKKTKRKKWEFPETIKWNWNRTFVFSKVLVVILNYYYDSTQRRKGDRKYWSKVTKDLSTCVSQPVLTQPSCFMCSSIAY